MSWGFGLFVELQDIFVEGLIPISTLKDDYYHFDAIRHKLRGERSGRIYKTGDHLKIKVVRVDLEDRQIDFVIVDSKLDSKKQITLKRIKK